MILAVAGLHSRRVAGYGRELSAEAVSKLCGNGKLIEAIDALGLLVQTESPLSTSLFYSLLKSCVAQKDLVSGRRIHQLAVKVGYESNTFLANHILRMYASHGSLKEAKVVFDRVAKPDVYSWSAVIAAHAKCGEPKQAVEMYRNMRSSSVKPDGHVFVAALQACSSASDLESGRQVHADLLESGIQPNLFVWNGLVDMYAKCGRLDDARTIFDRLATRDVVTCNAMMGGYVKCGRLEDARSIFESLVSRDVVTWTVMIAGYAEHEKGQEALSLYKQMKMEGLVLADPFTFACLLKVCARVGALQQGKELHLQILELGPEADLVVGTCLVDMYAKCGRLDEACRVFDGLPLKDVVTWNAMINGFGQSNEGRKAVEYFQEMLRDGVQPDEATFTCLLVACSHEGLVTEGQQVFQSMVEERGIMPTRDHYTCMVDLLARAGYLDEAERMLLAVEGDDVGFVCLLNACRSHGDIERGRSCFEHLVRSDPQNAAAYVLMGNIYADAGRWSDVERTEWLRKSVNATKKPAVAGIEVNRHVYTFVVGEEKGGIYSRSRGMNIRLKKEGGHVPHTGLVLKRVSEKEKEDELCGHAEKLALAYGLLNTPGGTPLLVTKNLRMCGDCHSSTEIMSRIEKREIIVRDAHRVHRFLDGSCRCGGRP